MNPSDLCPHVAMAKRLRSLASLLWDTDSCDLESDPMPSAIDLQLENAQLRANLQDLQDQVQVLQDRVMAAATGPRYARDSDVELGDLGSEHWAHRLRVEVRCLPRLWAEIIPSLHDANGNIEMDLPLNPKATASHVLGHAEKCIRQLSSKHPAVFKIGISRDPVARWTHPQYGYSRDRRERWQKMKVLCAFADSFSAALVESVLINKFKDTEGCRNERPGGETACPGDGPHFTYVTYKVLVPPARVSARV